MSKIYKPVTPTYQAVLNLSILDVVRALNMRDHGGAWDCLQTLINICPPKIQEEANLHLENVFKQVNAVKNSDLYQERLLKARILNRSIRPLLIEVMRLLHKEGYLEKPWGDRITPEHFKKLESKEDES